MKFAIAYVACPCLAIVILWLRQGRFIADVQIPAAVVFGPVSLLIAILAPRDMLTSKADSEGRNL